MVLSYLLYFSPASILFSAVAGLCSLLICLLNQGRFSCLCFNVRFVFSFRQDIPQSLVTLQNDPFLAKPVVDFIFLLIFICYIHSLFTLLALKIHLRLLRLSAGRARFRTSPPPPIYFAAVQLCSTAACMEKSTSIFPQAMPSARARD